MQNFDTIALCFGLNHGYTYSGHPACMAAAIANLELMESTNIIHQVKNNTAPYLGSKWRDLENHSLVGEARQLGMLAAIEIVEDKYACTSVSSDKYQVAQEV